MGRVLCQLASRFYLDAFNKQLYVSRSHCYLRRDVPLTFAQVSNTAYSYGNSGYPAEKVPEQPFYPVTHNDLRRLDHPNAAENQREVVRCSVSFTTD
jgi:hypothetical protein